MATSRPAQNTEQGPPLALTQGDPAGIGPEITLKAWTSIHESGLTHGNGLTHGSDLTFVVIGAARLYRETARALDLSVPIVPVASLAEGASLFPTALPVLDQPCDAAFEPGMPSPAHGPGVVGAIEQAVTATLEGTASAVVTNPITKAALYETGFAFPGHTEFLAALAGRALGTIPPLPVMMLASPMLKVVPLTIHVPLADVAHRITPDLIRRTARVTLAALKQDFGLERPRLAVAGLNPHAGEDGTIGTEDMDTILPAIQDLQAEGFDVRGPLSADTLFHERARATYDAALCMYHDQALIPIKALDFDRGVNVTLGLPFVRTSPDHGTAHDIAGRGVARADNLIAALLCARDMARARRTGSGAGGVQDTAPARPSS